MCFLEKYEKIVVLFYKKTMASSLAAWDPEQAALDTAHHQRIFPKVHLTEDKTRKWIRDMLDVVQTQSELQVTDITQYIFLSRIDGILWHMQIDHRKLEEYIRTIGKEKWVREDLINTHIQWRRLIKRCQSLSENFDIVLTEIRAKQDNNPMWTQLWNIWKKRDKNKFKWVITNVTQYQMLMRYFCLKKYGKTLEEWKNW